MKGFNLLAMGALVLIFSSTVYADKSERHNLETGYEVSGSLSYDFAESTIADATLTCSGALSCTVEGKCNYSDSTDEELIDALIASITTTCDTYYWAASCGPSRAQKALAEKKGCKTVDCDKKPVDAGCNGLTVHPTVTDSAGGSHTGSALQTFLNGLPDAP